VLTISVQNVAVKSMNAVLTRFSKQTGLARYQSVI